MPESTKQSIIDPSEIEKYVKIIFSWFILLPISVIVSGKLIAKVCKINITDKQLFEIPLKFFVISAHGDEVIWGFTGFITIVFFIGLFWGQAIPELLNNNFGLNIAHFNALCVFCSFFLVFISFTVFSIYKIASRIKYPSPAQKEHDDLIDRLASDKSIQ